MDRRSPGSAASISPSSTSSEHAAPTPSSDPPSAARSSGSSAEQTIASFATYATLHDPRCLAPTRSLAGGLALGTPTQVAAPDSSTPRAASGASSPDSSTTCGLTSSSSRMCAEPFRVGSMKCSPTWPSSGSMCGGRVCARATSEPLTDESGSSSWPTPTAADYGSSQNGSNASRPSGGPPSLSTRARTGEWATPLASDTHPKSQKFTNQGRPTPVDNLPMQVSKLWPTPIERNGSEAGSPGRPNPKRPAAGLDLGTEAKLWATPTTTDAASAARGTTTTGIMHSGESLTDQMRRIDGPQDRPTPKAGRGGPVLDPRFVEALMGFPDGWTVPASPMDLGALVSELLETRSSGSKPKPPSSSSSASLFPDDPDP
jgi:hypothetical protein